MLRLGGSPASNGQMTVGRTQDAATYHDEHAGGLQRPAPLPLVSRHGHFCTPARVKLGAPQTPAPITMRARAGCRARLAASLVARCDSAWKRGVSKGRVGLGCGGSGLGRTKDAAADRHERDGGLQRHLCFAVQRRRPQVQPRQAALAYHLRHCEGVVHGPLAGCHKA